MAWPVYCQVVESGIRNQRQNVGSGWSGCGLLDQHVARLAVMRLQASDHTVAECVEAGEEHHELDLEHEVGQGGLGTRPVRRTELDLADHAWRRIENGVAFKDLAEVVSIAEVNCARHQSDVVVRSSRPRSRRHEHQR